MPEDSLGNHEFDEKVEGLLPFIRNLSSPVLAANLILQDTPELQAETNLKPSIVINVAGRDIGIVGYLTPDTRFLAPPNKVQYEDEITAIKREVANLQKNNVNIIIALGHSGFLEDLSIAKEVEGIDLVIGGHSNTFLLNRNTTEEIPEVPLGPYPTMVQQHSGRTVPVVQAYAYTKYLGKLYMTFDSNGEIISLDGDPILLNNDIPKDPEMYDLVLKYHNDMEVLSNEVVGSAYKILSGESCRLRQCNIGNLITDAILEYMNENTSQCVTIAVVQGGRIRSSIYHQGEPFNLTRGDWLTVLPFSDTLTIINMNGSLLLDVLEHSVDTWRTVDSTGQFLQLAGIEVTYDLSKPPGSRVAKAKAIAVLDKDSCRKSDLDDINASKEYRVIMPSFIADGGDGFTMFAGTDKIVTTENEVTSVIDYLRKHSPINIELDNRIEVLNEDKVNDSIIINSQKSSSTSSIISSHVLLSHILLIQLIILVINR